MTERGEIRLSSEAQKIFISASQSTNPIEALKQLTQCVDMDVFCEVFSAIEFSPSNGEPIRYDWKPYERWDGRLWFMWGNSPALDQGDPLFKPLLSYLTKGKTVIIEVDKKRYIVRHVPEKSEGDWNNGGTTPNHIEFTKAD